MKLNFSVHALIINIAIYLFIFIIPYQALSLNATGFEIGLLMTFHSICYIFSTWLNSSFFMQSNTQKMIKLSYFLLTFVYFAAGMFFHLFVLGVLVCASGILLGIYWPNFWKIHSENKTGKRGSELCNSFSLMTFGVLVGPVLAGFAYQIFGARTHYIAAILSLFLFMTVLKRRKMNGVYRQPSQKAQEDEASFWGSLFFDYRKLLILLVWLDVALIGYLEGNFRSAGPIYMIQKGYSSQYWGLFLAFKLFVQIIVVLALKRVGPEKIISRKTHWWFFAMEISVVLGIFSFLQSKSFIGFSLSMILFGLGIGFIYYTGIYFSLLGSSEHGGGKNLSGLAESVLGIGILSGSLIGGALTAFNFRTPFLFLLGLVVLTIPGKYYFLFHRKFETKLV